MRRAQGQGAAETGRLFSMRGAVGEFPLARGGRGQPRGEGVAHAQVRGAGAGAGAEGAGGSVASVVEGIILDVRVRGDEALLEMALRFDGARLSGLEVPRAAWGAALAGVDARVRGALEAAAHNIRVFHEAQLPVGLEIEPVPGMRLGRRADPLRRVGVYAPGGTAAYPSSVLMGVVPAKVAGVDEVIVCSPPGADGLPSREVLAACALAGADRVFAVGGAGAIAALAVGTTSVPRVDKVVGPGNAYVTEAKRQLTGVVAIDSPAGPSEILVIADDAADPTLIAAELLAQAEHDVDAACVLVCTDARLADAVAARTAELLADQPRRDIIRAALAARGALLVAADLDEAVRFAEAYAPEHLLVATRDPRALLPRLRAAGTIFLGSASSVAFGDYMTGANHVLPTNGLARAYSGLSTLDFIRWTTYQQLSDGAAAALAPATVTLAEAEGLPAHALAARLRSAGSGTAVPGGEMDARGAAGAGAAAARGSAGAAHEGLSGSGAPATATVRLRPAYETLSLYDPGRLPCETDLSDNTNVFGPPPSLEALRPAADAPRITRYPSVYATDLKRVLAGMLGVEPSCIVTGCGSDDVIDSAVRAFCEPGDELAYPDPTFGMMPSFATMNAVLPVAVPLLDDFALDADGLVGAGARLTYLCRPNNPTGNAFARSATERVCTGAAGVVLVDEAYADFADDDMAGFAAASDRTVVLRTLSKAWGMAGLRVGYAVGPAPLIAEIEKSRGPYKVGGVAEAAALAVLSRDGAWVAARVAEVRQNRERLLGELAARHVRAWPSSAKPALLQMAGPASGWNGRLRARGVAVRPFAGLRHAGECLRVTVGPWPMMERFLAAFDDVLNTSAET
jgi:histidinol dehydrogenase